MYSIIDSLTRNILKALREFSSQGLQFVSLQYKCSTDNPLSFLLFFRVGKIEACGFMLFFILLLENPFCAHKKRVTKYQLGWFYKPIWKHKSLSSKDRAERIAFSPRVRPLVETYQCVCRKLVGGKYNSVYCAKNLFDAMKAEAACSGQMFSYYITNLSRN